MLNNSIYTDLSNLPDHNHQRTQIQNKIHPDSLTPATNKGLWQYTYTKLMAPYYYKGSKTVHMTGKTIVQKTTTKNKNTVGHSKNQ